MISSILLTTLISFISPITLILVTRQPQPSSTMDEVKKRVVAWKAKVDGLYDIQGKDEREAVRSVLSRWIEANRHLCKTKDNRFVSWPCLTRGGNARMDLLEGDELDTRFSWLKRLYDFDIMRYCLRDESSRIVVEIKEIKQRNPVKAPIAKLHDPIRPVVPTAAECRTKPGPYHQSTKSRRLPKSKPEPEEKEMDIENDEEVVGKAAEKVVKGDKSASDDAADIDKARGVAKDIVGKDWMRRLITNTKLAQVLTEDKIKLEKKVEKQMEQLKIAEKAEAEALKRLEVETRRNEELIKAAESMRKKSEAEKLKQEELAKQKQCEDQPQSASDGIPPSAEKGVFHGGFPLYAHVPGTGQYVPMEEWLDEDSAPFSAMNLYAPSKKKVEEKSAGVEAKRDVEADIEAEPAEKKDKDDESTEKTPAEENSKDEKSQVKPQAVKDQKKHKKKAKARVKF
ncbi:hypothetical protein F5Y18DRAFT_445086 [Xylariaceae sp. FL1019]|nr:hypothetical protein F5Y18DRAFT_445086 [Xylariaceae sp. FL1019]